MTLGGYAKPRRSQWSNVVLTLLFVVCPILSFRHGVILIALHGGTPAEKRNRPIHVVYLSIPTGLSSSEPEPVAGPVSARDDACPSGKGDLSGSPRSATQFQKSSYSLKAIPR